MNEDFFSVPKTFEPEMEGGGGGGSSRRRREPVIIGGGLRPIVEDAAGGETRFANELVRDLEEVKNTDLMSPLGAICNVFRKIELSTDKKYLSEKEIRDFIRLKTEAKRDTKDKSEKDKRAIEKEILEYEAIDLELSLFKDALTRWLGAPEFSEQVTLSSIFRAFRSVERGERVPDIFAPLLINLTKLGDDDAKRGNAIAALKESNRFERIISTLSGYNLNDAIAPEDQKVVREAVLDDVVDILANRDVIVVDRNLPAEERRRALWGDEPPTLIDLIEERAAANRIATGGLSEVLNQLLKRTYAARTTSGKGEKPASAYSVLVKNYGPIRIMSSALTLPRQGAQAFYRKNVYRKRGALVLDGSFPRPLFDETTKEPVMEDGEIKYVYDSLGYPISWLVAATHPDYEAIAGETEEKRAEVIKREIAKLKSTLMQFFIWFQSSGDIEVVPGTPEARAFLATGRSLINGITEQLIEQVASEAAKMVRRDPKAGLYSDLEEGPETPDRFARIQKVFTKTLFETLRSEDKKTIGDFLKEFSRGSSRPLENIYTTGLWRDEREDEGEGDENRSVDALLRSFELETEQGTKRFKVEGLLERLQSIAKNVDDSEQFPDYAGSEKEVLRSRVKLAAQAVYEIAHELRVERELAEANKVSSAAVTPKMYENFATAFGTLVSNNVLEPLPGEYKYPERRVELDKEGNIIEEKSESIEDYQQRLRRAIERRNDKAQKRRRAFAKDQARIIVRDLVELLSRLDEAAGGSEEEEEGASETDGDGKKKKKKKTFSGNFLGSVGNILNKPGKKLVAAIDARMKEIQERPPETISKALPEDPFELLPEAEREHYERLFNAVERIDSRITNEFERHIRDIGIELGVAARAVGTDPSRIAPPNLEVVYPAFLAFKAQLTKSRPTILDDIDSVRSRLEKERSKRTADAASRIILKIDERFGSIGARYDHLKQQFEEMERFIVLKKLEEDRTRLQTLASGATGEESVTNIERRSAQARLLTTENRIDAWKRAERLKLSVSRARRAIRDLERNLVVEKSRKGATPDTVLALEESLRKERDALTELGRREREAWDKALSGYDMEVPAFRESGRAAELALAESAREGELALAARDSLTAILKAQADGDAEAEARAQADFDDIMRRMREIDR